MTSATISLGLCCLNTVLRHPKKVKGEKKPEPVFTSRTMRFSTLEEKGFLYSPHTSSGRIPTDKGLKFFDLK